MLLLHYLTLFPAIVFALPTPHHSRNVNSHLLAALLPKGQGSSLWSVAEGIVDGAVPLNLDSFNASTTDSGAPAIFTNGTLQVNFKKGSFRYLGPQPSGLNMYAEPLDLSNAKEVVASYQIRFPEDFEYVKGGKLPGIYGGENLQVAKSCSGGRRDTNCHSVRFMWRTGGMGELYTYLPDPSFGPDFEGNKALCTIEPQSECNPTFGASVGRGSFTFPPGDFMTIGLRAKLNDVGSSNGELELIVNGQSKFNVSGLAYRNTDEHRFQGWQAQSFFGGNTADWQSSKDQSLEMKDFSLVVTETLT